MQNKCIWVAICVWESVNLMMLMLNLLERRIGQLLMLLRKHYQHRLCVTPSHHLMSAPYVCTYNGQYEFNVNYTTIISIINCFGVIHPLRISHKRTHRQKINWWIKIKWRKERDGVNSTCTNRQTKINDRENINNIECLNNVYQTHTNTNYIY